MEKDKPQASGDEVVVEAPDGIPLQAPTNTNPPDDYEELH